MRFRVCTLIFFCALAAAPAAAGDAPDAAALRSAIVSAAGPAPASYREVVRYRSSRESGSITTYVRGDDMREIDDDGDVVTQTGRYKGDAWHQNENGHTVIDVEEPGEAAAGHVTTTVTHVATPRDAYVLATLTAKGLGRKIYVDPATSYIFREERLRERSSHDGVWRTR